VDNAPRRAPVTETFSKYKIWFFAPNAAQRNFSSQQAKEQLL
jgi:hypothetical protein